MKVLVAPVIERLWLEADLWGIPFFPFRVCGNLEAIVLR